MNWGIRFQEQGNMGRMGIEKLGKGEEFANYMLGAAPFKVKVQGVANKDKGNRFENEMGPVFRSMKVRISNEPDNKYLRQFENEWLSWDGTESYTDDCLDAGWHGIVTAKRFIKTEPEDHTQHYDQNEDPYMGFTEERHG